MVPKNKFSFLILSLISLLLLSSYICILILCHNASIHTYFDNDSYILGVDDNHKLVNDTDKLCTSIECFLSNDILTKENVSFIQYVPLSLPRLKNIYLIHDDNKLVSCIIILMSSLTGIYIVFLMLIVINKL